MVRLPVILLVVLLFTHVTAFTTPKPRTYRAIGTLMAEESQPQSFVNPYKEKGVDVNTDASPAMQQASKPVNVVRDMNTGEVKQVAWTDPAMQANTNPFMMSWWAYILFGFPFVALANDFFDFLPKEGPFAILSQI